MTAPVKHRRACIVCRTCGEVVLRARALDWCPTGADPYILSRWEYPDGRDAMPSDPFVCFRCGAWPSKSNLLSSVEFREESS